ncbi:MAG TPA: enoyl-CoA hydratase-related protein [Acidobacteriaceae bacterium]|jgi:enoyl-CoA hydratase|nr:enoyl-CoA hydratase-related protein [Acidobacteriaceae bacterium]
MSMIFENILFEQRDGVAFVTLNRPRVLNVLNAATLAELSIAFTTIRSDDSIRAAVLTGAGEKAFAAGADIHELAQANGAQGLELARRGQAVFSAIEECGKPVIACINGFALGGGCELSLACTLRIAGENARLGQPEVKLGLIPGYGGTQRLPRLVGKGVALQLILTGEMISAADALRVGLVNEVVPLDQLLARGEQIARTIASMAPLAIRYSLEAVHRGYDVPLEEGLYLEASLFGLSCSTADKAEGTGAFLEKRAATWQGK